MRGGRKGKNFFGKEKKKTKGQKNTGNPKKNLGEKGPPKRFKREEKKKETQGKPIGLKKKKIDDTASLPCIQKKLHTQNDIKKS